MRTLAAIVLFTLGTSAALAQAALAPPATTPPTLDEVRRTMGVPSAGDTRGQQDAVGFASKPEQMARTWELSTSGPAPDRFEGKPQPGVAAIICPHDDYIYAARVYREIIPLMTAKTVVLVGVFHKYRKFGEHDRVVFDDYRAWRTPDGPVPVSPLRADILAKLPKDDYVVSDAGQDAEHSLEALVFWLRHQRPDLEIVPIIVPASNLDRLETIAAHVGDALASSVKARGWTWGKDVAIAISTDGVHYGADFKYVPYGDGGIDAYTKAAAKDRSLLTGPLTGPLSTAKIASLSETFVDPQHPDTYRLTWCGRFAVPFGLLVLDRTLTTLGLGHPEGHAVAYGTSLSQPELPLREVGMGATAPDSLYHFVGYPAAAFTTR